MRFALSLTAPTFFTREALTYTLDSRSYCILARPASEDADGGDEERGGGGPSQGTHPDTLQVRFSPSRRNLGIRRFSPSQIFDQAEEFDDAGKGSRNGSKNGKSWPLDADDGGNEGDGEDDDDDDDDDDDVDEDRSTSRSASGTQNPAKMVSWLCECAHFSCEHTSNRHMICRVLPTDRPLF